MGSLAQTQKAAVLKTTGRVPVFETRQVPIPDVGPTDILVKLSSTGVCGTDYGLSTGGLGPTRSILGHEGVGRIVRLGSAVSSSSFRVGQRVGISWIRDVCGECRMCLAPDGETRCEAQKQSGWKVDGTFAEYTVVPMNYVISLPEDIADELVAPILCGGVTAYKGLKLARLLAGQWVAVSGAGGGVGALAIMYAKAMGYRVLAIDIGESKMRHCLEAGADRFVDAAAEADLKAAVHKITDGGANAVLVAAPSPAAYQSSISLLANFGTLVCLGIPPPSGTMTIHPLEFIDRGIHVTGSVTGTRGDILEALEFVRRGAVTPIVKKASLDDVTSILGGFASGKTLNKFVIRL